MEEFFPNLIDDTCCGIEYLRDTPLQGVGLERVRCWARAVQEEFDPIVYAYGDLLAGVPLAATWSDDSCKPNRFIAYVAKLKAPRMVSPHKAVRDIKDPLLREYLVGEFKTLDIKKRYVLNNLRIIAERVSNDFERVIAGARSVYDLEVENTRLQERLSDIQRERGDLLRERDFLKQQLDRLLHGDGDSGQTEPQGGQEK